MAILNPYFFELTVTVFFINHIFLSLWWGSGNHSNKKCKWTFFTMLPLEIGFSKVRVISAVIIQRLSAIYIVK